MPADRERVSLLLDYYGDLLTRHQFDIMDQYFNEDLSMNEIADSFNVSKSAVQDLIKKTASKLEDLEDKMRLIETDMRLNGILNEMREENDPLLDKYVDKINSVR